MFNKINPGIHMEIAIGEGTREVGSIEDNGMSKELSDYTSRDPVTLLSSIETMYRQFGLDTIADGAIPTMDGQGQRKRSISQGLIDLSFIRALTGNGRPGFKDIPSDILLKLGVASTDEDRGRWMLDKSFN